MSTILNQTELAQYQTLNALDPKSLIERGLKLAEETGEVSQALLSQAKASGCEYKGLTEADVMEECLDVIIVAKSIIASFESAKPEELQALYEAKLAKWQEKATKSSC